MVDPSAQRYFFVHLMKVSGGSFKKMIRERVFPPPAFYPNGRDDPDQYVANCRTDYLARLSHDRRGKLLFYSAHMPFAAHVLIEPEPKVLSFFREPVARTVSYLKQWRRHHCPGTGLVEIYEDGFQFHGYIHNYMTKMFSARNVAELPMHMSRLDLEPWRLEVAKENVDRLAFFGLQERYEESIAACERIFGWDLGPPAFRNVGDKSDADEGLHRRIAEDNPLDFELYAHVARRFEERFLVAPSSDPCRVGDRGQTTNAVPQ